MSLIRLSLKPFFAVLFLLCFLSSAYGSARDCRRVVSLAPSVTEVLFALDLGESVVGVTRYCDYPPEALEKKKVGGFYDTNYEALLRLRPDVVMLLEEHERKKKDLSALGIKTLTVNHRTVEGILSSITTIGRLCGREEKARRITERMRREIGEIRAGTAALERPRVMVSINRPVGEGTLHDVYIAGREGFYSRLVKLAGGRNAYTGEVKFPLISSEAIAAINPDVIIDIIPDLEKRGLTEKDALEDWKGVPGLRAAKTGRIYVLSGYYAVRPGPRFVRILKEMARAIHPEVMER